MTPGYQTAKFKNRIISGEKSKDARYSDILVLVHVIHKPGFTTFHYFPILKHVKTFYKCRYINVNPHPLIN